MTSALFCIFFVSSRVAPLCVSLSYLDISFPPDLARNLNSGNWRPFNDAQRHCRPKRDGQCRNHKGSGRGYCLPSLYARVSTLPSLQCLSSTFYDQLKQMRGTTGISHIDIYAIMEFLCYLQQGSQDHTPFLMLREVTPLPPYIMSGWIRSWTWYILEYDK